MFRGRFEHTVDEKGRTSLPARFREKLAAQGESRLVITTGLEPCLVAYSLREWEAFEERVAQLPSFDKNVARLKRIYVSGATECDIDKLGRIQLTADLRQHANLTREVMWAGLGKTAELWDAPEFKARTKAVLDDAAALEDMTNALAGLHL